MAFLNLARHGRRTGLALAIICGGVVSLLLAGGFINWVLASMEEGTIRSQLGHVQVTRPGFFEEGVSDPYRFLLGEDLSVVSSGSGFTVETIAPRLSFTGLLSKGESTISFVGEGIDPQAEAPVSRAVDIIEGRDLTESPTDSVLLGEGLAASIEAQTGDSVVLLVTTASGGINAVELKVAGTFATITKAFDDTVLRVPIDVARTLLRTQGATTWTVLLTNTEDTDRAVGALRRDLPADQFEVTSWRDLADFYNKTVELFSTQVNVVRALIALIVVLSISNTLSMTVVERTGEIGTSLALGMKRYKILSLFIWEGAMLGVIGGVIGVAVGHAMAAIISSIGIPMPPPPGMARGYIGEIDISLSLAVEGFVLAFVTTLIASLIPARKASRMNIVDALRHQS